MTTSDPPEPNPTDDELDKLAARLVHARSSRLQL
jgi:hypothetical protein